MEYKNENNVINMQKYILMTKKVPTNKKYSLIDRQKLLIKYRELYKMTQEEVANYANVPVSLYKKIESGEVNIGAISFKDACEILKVLMGTFGPAPIYNDDYDWIVEYFETIQNNSFVGCYLLSLKHLKKKGFLDDISYQRLRDFRFN